MDTRREFLKKALLLSGAAGFSTMVPASIQRALAIDPTPGSTFLDAEHVVILMQENRSFDHCFGVLRGVRGFNDPRTITLPDKNLAWLQSDKKGKTYAPFHFDIETTKITWMGSIPHTRSSQVDADNLGKYNQWLEAKRSGNKKYADMPLTMGHYDRRDLPFNYAMADAFTICDQHFCSAMTSTWPNRLYLWSGTIRGEKSGEAKAYIRNDIPYGEAHWKTFPERLEENNVSWKVYQNDITTGGGYQGEEASWLSNFGCNPLEFLSQFNARFSPKYTRNLENRIQKLQSEISDLKTKISAATPSDKNLDKLQKDLSKKNEVLADANAQLIQWSRENFEKLSEFQKNIYDKAFATNEEDPDYHSLETLSYEDQGVNRDVLIPKGDFLYQFRKDVNEGKLPTVSWLVPSQNFSDHPSAPWYGTWLTSEILDILTKNPDVWKKTIFILTYDENDGYYDHVPPFTAPDPKDPATGKCSAGVNITGVEFVRREQELSEGIHPKEARSGPIGLGFRVPMIIASPWTRGGKVCSQIFDHTSVIQFMETYLNKKYDKHVKQDNISEWRRTVCGDLTSAFTQFNEKKEALPFLSLDPFVEKIYNAKFKDEPTGFKILSDEEIKKINNDPLSSNAMSHQEPGTRPANALPYELYAEGKLSADKKSFEITMQAQKNIFDNKSAGSPFKIYAPGEYLTLVSEKSNDKKFEPVRAWNYAVSAGDSLTDQWPLAAFKDPGYHLRVYGPNGFYREFTGDENDPEMDIHCQYQQSRLSKNKLTGNVELVIRNSEKSPVNIQVVDNAYGGKTMYKKINGSSNENVILDLKNNSGWYDFTIRVKGNKNFTKRYAGRVETGNETISDPYMGRIT